MSEIKPALTAEEWTTPGAVELQLQVRLALREGPQDWVAVGHAVAAHVLNGHPDGFTPEDVQRLEDESDELKGTLTRLFKNGDRNPATEDLERLVDRLAWLESLAKRIAALLPPRAPIQEDGG